jgi:hypothetical protein
VPRDGLVVVLSAQTRESETHPVVTTAELTSPRRSRMLRTRKASLAEELLHRTRRPDTLGTHVPLNGALRMFDAAFWSHAIAWLIGLMAVGATVVTFGALFSMGRSGYRKD